MVRILTLLLLSKIFFHIYLLRAAGGSRGTFQAGDPIPHFGGRSSNSSACLHQSPQYWWCCGGLFPLENSHIMGRKLEEEAAS